MKTPFLSIFLTSAFVPSLLPAVEWDGDAGDGDFNNASNWEESPVTYLYGVFGSGSEELEPGLSFDIVFLQAGDRPAEFRGSPSPVTTVMSDDLTTTSLVVDNAAVNLNSDGNTLTLTSDGVDVQVVNGGSLTFTGNLAGTGASDFDLDIAGSANFQNGSIIAEGDINLVGGGTLAASNLTITPNGGDFTVGGGTELSPGGAGFGSVEVDGDMGGTGTWVFNADDAANTDMIDVNGELDISGFTLDLSGAATGVSPINSPIIIASYDSLTGGAFANDGTVNLPAGKWIDYNFNGNSIAIVPEVTYAFPLLLAFLPLMGRRSRK